MQRQILLSAAIALSSVAKVAGQAATATANPLNNFIGAAGAAASQISSANAAEAARASSSATSSTSASSSTSPSTTATPPPPASTSKAAAASSGLSSGAKIGIIIGAIVAALLLLAIIAGLCCCLVRSRRRRKRRAAAPIEGEGSPRPWKSPISPGRHYSNYTPAQRGEVPMEQHPTVPLMAAAATDHNARSDKPPSLSQHPAMRQPQNPFVPVPPSPRREPNHRSGVTDGLIAGAGAGAGAAAISHHRHHNKSGSRDNLEPQTGALPTHYDPNRPPTPFGLTGFGTPAGQTVHPNQPAHINRGGSPPYNGIGQPYDDMHVHVLQSDPPSRELRHSLNKHEASTFPAAIYDDPNHHKYRNSRGYSTPPEVPSRSPNRQRAPIFADSSYDSSLSTTTNSSSSGERYQQHPDPYGPAQRESVSTQPWQQHNQRFSDAHIPRASAQTAMAAPPIPWEEDGFGQNRRQSHSPRQSGTYDRRRRDSRSPATSINGTPRRLRFEDLQAGGGAVGVPQQQQQMQQGQGYGNGHGHGGVMPAQGQGQGHARNESYDGYGYDQRWSQGVGEAL